MDAKIPRVLVVLTHLPYCPLAVLSSVMVLLSGLLSLSDDDIQGVYNETLEFYRLVRK